MPGATRKPKRVRATDPLLHAVADASRVLIESNDVVCAIPRALRVIGEVAGASRAQLAWEDVENARHRVAYAWTGPGAGCQLQDESSLIPNDFLGPKLHLLHSGKSVLFEDPAEFPETARAFIADLGIAATAAVPIMVGGAYAGMLCFDFDHPVELDPKLEVLQASAHAIAAAVQRQKDLQAWADERQRAAEIRASELTAANAALVNREKVLASVAEVSRLLLCPEKVSDVLSQCMQVLGEAGDLDRVNLLRSGVDERTGALYHVCEYEWVRAGFVAQMSNPEFLISYDSDFPALADPVRAGRSFWYQVDAMENPLREFLQSVGVKTTAGVPVFVDAAYYGCLSFNTCRAARPWAQHDLDLLQAAAGAIGAALDRELLVERVTEQRERASLERVAELARTNEALRRGVGRVSQTRDVRLLLQGSVQEACRIAEARAGAVLAINATARNTVLAATTPSFQPSSDWVLLEPRLIAGDLVEQLDVSGGLCYVPLLLGGELQGTMVLQRDSARPVDVTTRETLRALAHQSALLIRLDALVDAEKTAAIAQAREQETRKRAAELAQANDAIRRSVAALGRGTSTHSFLVETLSETAALTAAISASLLLHDAPRNVLRRVSRVVNGREQDVAPTSPEPEYCVDESSLAEVWSRLLESGAPVEVRSGQPAADLLPAGLGSSGLILPMMRGPEVTGIVVLSFSAPFDAAKARIEVARVLVQNMTLAVELERLGEESKQSAISRHSEQLERERASELAKINDALRDTLSRLVERSEIEGFVEHVLQHSAIRTGGVSSALFLHDPEANTLGMAACVLHGVPVDVTNDERVAMWRSVDAGVSPLWRVMCESPTEYYIQRTDSDTPVDWPGAPEWHRSMGHRLVLCIPVRVASTPLGFTAICYAQPSAMTEARIQLARAFGQLTAAALELTRLSEQATAAALAQERQLAAIQHAASLEEVNAILRDSLRRMSARSNVDDFLGFVLEKVGAAVQASHVHLFRFDASQQTLTLHLSWLEGELRHGPSGDELPLWAAPFSVDVTPAWKLMVEDRKFFSPENTPIPAAEFAWPGAIEWLRRRNASDAAHTVLFVADEPVGSIGLTFTGGKRLKPEAQPLVQALAQQAAIALRLSELADRATTAAVAHERERSAQERLAELTEANAIMRRSVVSLADNPQFESFLGTLLVETCRVTQAKAAHLFVIQPDDPSLMRLLTRVADGRVYSAADSGGDPAFLWAPMSREWCCELFTPHRPRDVKRMDVVSVPDEAMCSGAREWYRSQGYATCTVLPVFVSGAPAGVIVVFFSGEQQSSRRDKEILEVLLTQVELGLQLSRLAEAAKGEAVRAAVASERQNAAEDRAREVNEVNRALQATISTLAANPTLESFIAHVLRVVTSRLSAQSSAFWFSGEEPGAVLHIEHPEPAAIARRTIASAQWHASRLQHLEENRDLRVITDPQQFALHDDADPEGIRSLLLIPLALSEEILGCLVVRSASTTVYDAGELELVQALANQAMLAIQLSRLAKKAEVAAVMEERNRLAREIHDILAQGLTGIVLMLEAAKSYLGTPSPDSAAEPLQSALELARESLAEARRSVNALRPASLDSGGLDAAFEQLAGRHQQVTGAVVTLDLAPDRPQVSPEVEVNLLRIVQEALNNAARHARATHIRIELAYESGRLRLGVIDNGRGFDPVALDPAQMIGITGMRERAARAGGELSVRSQPGAGTRVTAVIPVTDENAIRTISYS